MSRSWRKYDVAAMAFRLRDLHYCDTETISAGGLGSGFQSVTKAKPHRCTVVSHSAMYIYII